MKETANLQFITQKTSEEAILSEVSAFLEGGGRWVQLRMKEATDEQMIAVGTGVQRLCKAAGATFIINDRVSVALALKADGVHLGKSDISTSEARKVLGAEAIIGRTANTMTDILGIALEGNDYIGLGPYRFTTTKKNLSPTLGADGYRHIFSQLSELGIEIPPVVGIGGVTLQDVDLLCNTGLHGLAISGEISNAPNPVEATRLFQSQINEKFRKRQQ